MSHGGVEYSPPDDAACAICDRPTDAWDVRQLVTDGVHLFNHGRRAAGKSPVCSAGCLDALRGDGDGG